MSDRPDPDALLARVQAEERRARRGKLKIFFGYIAGVGKTFAMLQAARRENEAGAEVVVGYVEPHGRRDTEELLQGLEQLPFLDVTHRGVKVREFDLDAALARKPSLLLVDELAHTNAEGMRHVKRWQDVDELLEAGIDVYTTLNVQHVESLNDVVAEITGVVVRETVPDLVIETADEIELVDLVPEELLERLKSGRVYAPAQAEQALGNFFQKGKLTALRELALRQTARRVGKDVAAARREADSKTPWATDEKILVCVGPSPTGAKLVRAAKRMAEAFGAEWLAVSVNASARTDRRDTVTRLFRLAERLGAETHTLTGDDFVCTLVEFARSRNVTKIIIGKSSRSRLSRLLFGSLVDSLIDRSGDIDVYVIRGGREGSSPIASRTPRREDGRFTYLKTAAILALCCIAGSVSFSWKLTESNIVMVFLLGVVFAAARYGRGPAIFAATAGVLLFDFLFVPPYLTFSVNDLQYLLTFAVMLTVGLVIATLTTRLRERLDASRATERRTAALFRLTKQLSQIGGVEFLLRMAGKQLEEIFEAEVVLHLKDDSDLLKLRHGAGSSIVAEPINEVVARWVADHRAIAGAGTDTLPNGTALFAPLIGSQRTLGAVGVKPRDPNRFADPEQGRLLETCAGMIALSLERDQSVIGESEAEIRVQTERLRNALLSSISHDLRTPLAVIAGASSRLQEKHHQPSNQVELLQTIIDESHRLTRLVDNLLDMTKLSSGTIKPNRQWHVLEELVSSALVRLRHELERYDIVLEIPPEFPLIAVDGVLFEQLFFNLLENAARYTPEGTEIHLRAAERSGRAVIVIEDNGPGLPEGSESLVFEKFFRGGTTPDDGRRGAGLGLTICRGIVEAHEGTIEASRPPEGGVRFTITLPLDANAPSVPREETEYDFERSS